MDDDFVPEGCRRLLSAIEHLAQVGKTSIQSAQEEIRPKLHSGSIMTCVLRKSTGELLPMKSDGWATERAQRWLESGVCQLPDDGGYIEQYRGFVNPRESATIFVVESGLRRLIEAKSSAGKKRLVRPVISAAEAERRFDEWRKDRGDNIPSPAEDFGYMRQYGVSRDLVRRLRKRPGVTNRPRGHSPPAKLK